ncbi:MAG: ABC transporter permease subunit, partial [Acidimicrobiia bacterium]|nr:ABC transporter permease subunit [Acidimicrobiia bacterium]
MSETPGSTTVDDTTTPIVSPSTVKKSKYRKRGQVAKWLSIVWLVLLVFTAVGASWLPYVKHSCDQFDSKADCRTHINPNGLLSERPPASRPIVGDAPARVGLMGTDTNGFDIFSRAMFGARNSLLIGAMSIVFGILIGGTLGLIAGYVGKKTDRVIDTVMNIFLSFPALLLAIFIVGFFGSSGADEAKSRSIGPIILALVILSIPPIAR